MGKISEAGQSSATVTGEMMIEVSNTKQTLDRITPAAGQAPEAGGGFIATKCP
jgi:hypothetical protein